MKSIRKRILPILLGAMVIIPSVSAFAEGESTEAVKTKVSSVLKMRDKAKVKMTEEQKELLESIREQIKEGTLTREEASEKLAGLNINFGFMGNRNFKDIKQRPVKFTEKLTEEQRAQLKEIKEAVKEGTMTKEEAVKKIEELGLNFHKGDHKGRFNSKLTEEQKEALKEIKEKVQSGEITREEAKEMIKELELPIAPIKEKLANMKGHFLGRLTEEQREQIKDIKDQIEAGTLTREEAKEKFQELGLNIKKIRANRGEGKNVLTEENKEAIKEIKDLLKAGEITREEAMKKFKEILKK